MRNRGTNEMELICTHECREGSFGRSSPQFYGRTSSETFIPTRMTSRAGISIAEHYYHRILEWNKRNTAQMRALIIKSLLYLPVFIFFKFILFSNIMYHLFLSSELMHAGPCRHIDAVSRRPFSEILSLQLRRLLAPVPTRPWRLEVTLEVDCCHADKISTY